MYLNNYKPLLSIIVLVPVVFLYIFLFVLLLFHDSALRLHTAALAFCFSHIPYGTFDKHIAFNLKEMLIFFSTSYVILNATQIFKYDCCTVLFLITLKLFTVLLILISSQVFLWAETVSFCDLDFLEFYLKE